MMHDFPALPPQQQASPGVPPVVNAVESARFLREQLDLLPTATAADREVLGHELAMLQHYLHTATTESGEYPAVVDGLAHFAHQTEVLLATTELPDLPTPRQPPAHPPGATEQGPHPTGRQGRTDGTTQ